jgi:Haem-binding domain
MKRILIRLILAGLALLLVIQLVPYGRGHANPPVTQAAVFHSATVNQIVTDSCADCHSNLTKWPWYTNVAPASWLVMNDVDGGRKRLNLSEWDTPQPPLDAIVEQIQNGEMPPLKYKVMPNHSKARLSSKQKQELIAGFTQLYATQPPAAIRRRGGG